MFQLLKYPLAAMVLAAAMFGGVSRAHASWLEYSQADLLKESSLIITGELIEMTSITNPADGKAMTVGVIKPDLVLKGKPGSEPIYLRVLQYSEPRTGADIFYKIGQKGIWFLELPKSGKPKIYLAFHPQRFEPESAARIKEIRELLAH